MPEFSEGVSIQQREVKADPEFIEWLKTALVGKSIEFRGYHFSGQGQKYRAIIKAFGVGEYVGGPQFKYALDGIQKFDEKTGGWESVTDNIAIQGHVHTFTASVEGSRLVLSSDTGTNRVEDVVVPEQFLK